MFGDQVSEPRFSGMTKHLAHDTFSFLQSGTFLIIYSFLFYLHWHFDCVHVCMRVLETVELELQIVLDCPVDARN